MNDRANRNAFTLVEILIVVVILGILSSVVVPNLRIATDSAKTSSILAHLQRVTRQLDIYLVDQKAYPDLVTDQWTPLINAKYLKSSPKNIHNGLTLVMATPEASAGWTWDGKNLGATYFDEDTGRFTPEIP